MAHFLVPAARMWDDVVHTCAHQRLFCSEDCVGDWLAATGSARGYVMDLGTLWRLAAHWYDGRLERGYVRREPSQAAAVFPREIAPPIRRFAEQSDTVVHWTEFDPVVTSRPWRCPTC